MNKEQGRTRAWGRVGSLSPACDYALPGAQRLNSHLAVKPVSRMASGLRPVVPDSLATTCAYAPVHWGRILVQIVTTCLCCPSHYCCDRAMRRPFGRGN